MAWITTKMAKATVTALAVLLVAGAIGILVFRHSRQYQGPSHFPKQSWAAAGAADPVSALETACFANLHGDGKTMLAGLGPGLQAAVKQAWEKNAKAQGVSQEDYFASQGRQALRYVLGFRVLGEKFLNPDEVQLHIYVQGWWEKVTLKMQRINQQWKVTGIQWE